MRANELIDRWSQEQLATGIETGALLKMLKAGGWKPNLDYLHRVAMLGGLSLPSTLLGRVDDAMYASKLAQMDIDPTPLIVIGHWRSGTTHLHGLLGRDPNHTYSTVYQVVFPSSFLATGKIGPRLLKNALPPTRTYDNMAHGWFEPAEDEIGLLKLTGGLSFYSALMFPDRYAQYEKYIDFLEATEEERRIWKNAVTLFIKKMMLATGGKRVILKSCPHSARIRMLLELFPDAKFIHIHRHPARVFRSMVHMRSKVDWENFLSRPEQAFLDQRWEHTALLGERLFTRIIEDRELIPEQNLVEIAYGDFIGNETRVLREIYDKFNLPDWERFERVLTPYLDTLKGYKVNKLTMEPELADFVYERWQQVYDTYGYTKEFKS
ncbi:MAG: sulfotransferase [Deltaproteobacteria bacterium]|nr:sulfotransferase [Deltaproteobacteria bacterium]